MITANHFQNSDCWIYVDYSMHVSLFMHHLVIDWCQPVAHFLLSDIIHCSTGRCSS